MSPPWMPLYVADYIKDTGHLSAAEHGAYLLLIMHYWSTGGLPTEDKRLASIARLSLDEWQSSRDTIAAFFEDGWKHSRIERHLAEAEESYNRRVEAGRKGGKAKAESKHSSSKAKAELIAPLKQSEPEPDISLRDEARGARDRRIETECRKIAATSANPLPVLVDQNFAVVLEMLDAEPSLTETDVYTAMTAVVETRHRLEFWSKLGNWIRRAAKDRLGAAMPPANYARAGPADPRRSQSSTSAEGRKNAGKARSAQDVARDYVEGFARRNEGDPDTKLLA